MINGVMSSDLVTATPQSISYRATHSSRSIA
jgi:hypothetical protein